jgi:hypothetical protein
MGVADRATPKAFGGGFGHPHFLFGDGQTTPFDHEGSLAIPELAMAVVGYPSIFFSFFYFLMLLFFKSFLFS